MKNVTLLISFKAFIFPILRDSKRTKRFQDISRCSHIVFLVYDAELFKDKNLLSVYDYLHLMVDYLMDKHLKRY